MGDITNCLQIEEEPPSSDDPLGIWASLFSKAKPQSKAEVFKNKYYPNSIWDDWKWQVRNSIKSLEQLEKIITLTESERLAISLHKGNVPLRITPYYASLLDIPEIRKTVIPTMEEYSHSADEADDPLNEDASSPVPGIIHRYPDKLLFLISNLCATNCRYCTRSRGFSNELCGNWEKGLEYIRQHTEVRDVLLSGGDPLMLADDKIEYLLKSLRNIPHVEFVRIGTKTPIVVPQRITKKLCNMIKKYHPVWMSLHFTHPAELTPETSLACNRLADAGIPLGSQTVLLKDINNNPETMKKLMQGLLKIRCRPYYIYACDPILGSGHFRTRVQEGVDIIKHLRGYTSGYAVPTYVIDAPGGGGKIPVHELEYDEEGLKITNFRGIIYHYPENE